MLFEIDIQTIALLMLMAFVTGFMLGVVVNKPQGR